MMPAIIAKNVENSNERWKPVATMGEENVKNIHAGELPPSFITIDGNIYYLSSEIVNAYQHPAVVEPGQNGSANGQESQAFSQQLSGPEVLNHGIQNDKVSKDIPVEELKRLIQLQFEYYFSRENLANDSYLVSQMDSDQYVHISTVAKFNQIRKLTSDMNLIVESLKESPYVQLDETAQKVRANAKRCIVILREIPESTPIEEVKALLCHPNCPKWVSFEFAHNDSWYVTFDCEEDAKKAYHYLHEEVQQFRGRPLMARIKAQTLLSRTVYLPKSASTPSSVTVTSTSPPINTTQFTTVQQPINTFTVPPNAIFHQPQSFPFYAATPLSGTPVIPGAWIGPRPTTFYIQQDIHPKNTFNKHKPEPIQFISKGRVSNRNNFKYPKLPLQQCNGSIDNNEQQARRGQNLNTSNGTNTFPTFKKEMGRFVRGVGNARKEFRSNGEEGTRYQRLRDRQHKENAKSPEVDCIPMPPSTDLTLDLAIENFPALPSPNSPIENGHKTASSLKDLASSALRHVADESTSSEGHTSSKGTCKYSQEKQSIEVSLSEGLMNTCISSVSLCPNNSLSQNPKMSYAQMAQMPNKQAPLCKETFENDVKDFTELPNAEIVKGNDHLDKCKTETVCTTKVQRKTSKESLKPQRSSEAVPDSASNITDDSTMDCQLDNDAMPRETYASRFGKTPVSSQLPISKGNSPCTNTANTSWVNHLKNVSSTKPLMSQVIKPNNGKGQEQIQEESQKLSFINDGVDKDCEHLGKRIDDSSPFTEDVEKMIR